jgi:hypothetical protein
VYVDRCVCVCVRARDSLSVVKCVSGPAGASVWLCARVEHERRSVFVSVRVCMRVRDSVHTAPTGPLNITGQGFEPCQLLVPHGQKRWALIRTGYADSQITVRAVLVCSVPVEHPADRRSVWHLNRPSVLCTPDVIVSCLVGDTNNDDDTDDDDDIQLGLLRCTMQP